MTRTRTAVLLPVYQPEPDLADLVAELRAVAPAVPVIVVDDGSGPAHAGTFRALDAEVVRHDRNRGKGAALKTGLRHLLSEHPEHAVVCADADGQHLAEDIVRVGEHVAGTGRIALGVRRFDRAPWRSRVGNRATEALFRVATGRHVRDTQTGLRGYPSGLVEWLTTIEGEGFDYEMRVLLEAARAGHPVDELAVPTIYRNGNASSKFSPLSDSARIYRPLLKSLVEPRKG